MEKNKPIKTYKVGLLSLVLWENKLEDNKKFYTFTFQRSFKDEKENVWKQTQTLNVNELPKLKILIEEAYKEFILKGDN